MPESPATLRDRIRDLLARTPRLKATEIAQMLGSDRREVNRCLSYELVGHAGGE